MATVEHGARDAGELASPGFKEFRVSQVEVDRRERASPSKRCGTSGASFNDELFLLMGRTPSPIFPAGARAEIDPGAGDAGRREPGPQRNGPIYPRGPRHSWASAPLGPRPTESTSAGGDIRRRVGEGRRSLPVAPARRAFRPGQASLRRVVTQQTVWAGFEAAGRTESTASNVEFWPRRSFAYCWRWRGVFIPRPVDGNAKIPVVVLEPHAGTEADRVFHPRPRVMKITARIQDDRLVEASPPTWRRLASREPLIRAGVPRRRNLLGGLRVNPRTGNRGSSSRRTGSIRLRPRDAAS